MCGGFGGCDALTFGNGVFCSVTGSLFSTSTDGVTWKNVYGSGNPVIGVVAYGNGKFVTGELASSTTRTYFPTPAGLNLLSSSIDTVDAIASYDSGGKATQVTYFPGSWDAGPSIQSSGVAFGAGLFVSTPLSGTTAYSSHGGATWTARTLPASANWQAVNYIGSAVS